MKIEMMKGKMVAIHCDTRSEAESVLSKFESATIRWASGKPATKQDIICDCILFEETFLMQADRLWITPDSQYTIITASQFLSSNP